MMSTSRSAQLQTLQTLTEMQEFLDFIGCEGNFSSCSSAMSLLKKWSSREADTKLHSVDIWDDIFTNRFVYLDKILMKYKKSSSFLIREDAMEVDDSTVVNVKQLENTFTRTRVMFSLRLSEAATEQVNFPVAKKQLQKSLHFVKDTLNNDRDLEVLWTHTYSEMNCKKCLVLSPEEAIETATSAIEQLDKLKDSKVLQEDLSAGIRHNLLRSTALDTITKALQENGTSAWESLNSNLQEKLVKLYGGKHTDGSEKVLSQLTTKSFTTLQLAVKTAQSYENNQNTNSRKKMVTSLMTMANFCDRLLRLKEDNENGAPKIDMKMFPGIVIRYVLKAMAYESTEARQKFPRLLQLVELYPGNDVDAFVRKAADVPCWMFIGWINQMVALLDKKESRSVHGILQELTAYYPQALVYPFKISSEQFKFGGSLEEQQNKHFVQRLQDSLSSPLLDKFVESLEQLTNPGMVFRDWVDEVKPMLAVKSNDTSVRESYVQMYKKLFDVQSKGLSTNCVEMGSIRRRFAQEFSKEVVKKCGADGSRIVGMSATNFAKEMNDLVEKMKRAAKSGGNLKDYSPWLSRFLTLNHVQELEIPGQYTGKAKPLPEYHVKIAGFDEKVLFLKSLRVPKRITILGNDEKEYKFLVKGGEDLRLDQRIEQLFCLMNDIMDNDPACQQRNLSLKTYKVIPMTSRIGVIEWLENTTVFRDFFVKGMTEQEKNAYMSVGDIHHKWLSSFPPVKKAPASVVHYYSMLKKASRRDVERKFSEMQNLIPGDSLRRSFLQLSSSPEAFLMLRSYFARTHGCLSICHYILGIGDRHLNNIMIDLQTGGVVGIDFGHAFGSATQFLTLPELMPFRLTRQICNLMLPLRESGQLQSTMVYTLRALRNNHEILLNTMDVFIKEPSLDWQNFARKQIEKQKMSSDFLTDQTWYPREKVNSAKRKLRGENPAEVMKVDLDLGHKNVDHYRALLAVLLGDKQYNQRARPYSSSVENQVACLIDQATDPNILARTYAGWQPWV